MTPEYLAAPGLDGHGTFFTRRGGVSQGCYASLNCSLSGGDDVTLVARNRALVAEAVGVGADRLVGVTQVHGAEAVLVDTPWMAGQGPRADAMVTRQPGLALGIITADCAPVLFRAADAGIVGAAHAGWRGAVAGVLEAVIDAMVRLGADRARIAACVGPCIGQESYEVGDDLRMSVLPTLDGADRFFAPGIRPAHWRFDLAGYCLARLERAGVGAIALGVDTYTDPDRFFSHRRRTLAGGGPIGHQISVIRTP